jgi:hypothetical protein
MEQAQHVPGLRHKRYIDSLRDRHEGREIDHPVDHRPDRIYDDRFLFCGIEAHRSEGIGCGPCCQRFGNQCDYASERLLNISCVK